MFEGLFKVMVGVAAWLHRQVRGLVAQAEHLALTCSHAKAGHAVMVLAVGGAGAAQDQPVGAGNRTQGQRVDFSTHGTLRP